MREIKFRAWDTQLNEWLGADEWSVRPDGSVSVRAFSEAAGRVVNVMVETSRIKLLQYTGLKDQNGVEIYEGDIVKWSSTHQGASKNVRIDRVVWSSEHAVYLLIPFIHEPWAAEMEVIGNVYENPELGND